MPSLRFCSGSIFAFTCLAGLGVAIPAPASDAVKVTRIPLTGQPVADDSVFHFLEQEIVQTNVKYGVLSRQQAQVQLRALADRLKHQAATPPPANGTHGSAAHRRDGTIAHPLYNHNNVMYYGSVQVGTPGQAFQVVFDTGSADFWIPSTRCESLVCSVKHRFDSHESSTYEAGSNTFYVRYGTGSVEGIQSWDTTRLGAISVPRQPFGESTELDSFFSRVPMDGIVGLAYSALSKSNSETLFERMVRLGLLAEPIFSFYVSPQPNQGGSEMILGGVDAARFQAPLLYVPVVKRKYWEVELRGMTVGGGNAGRRPKQGASDSPLDLQAQTAIIDTGTTLILMNEGDADTVNAAVGASRDGSSGKLYSITCDTSSLPAVTLHLGDYAFSLPPEAYVVPGRDGSCSTGFSVSSMPTQWIVGNTFLRYYYSVYDASSHRVGFGKSI